MTDKLILTVLFHIKPEKKEIYKAYEKNVLPLLSKYNGELLHRISLDKTTPDQPDEIHVLSFETAEDFKAYQEDEERKKHTPLFQESVNKTEVFKGRLI